MVHCCLAIECMVLNLGTVLFCQFGSVISGNISSRSLSLLLPLPKMTNTSINGEKGQNIKSDHEKQKTKMNLHQEVQITWRLS